MTPNQTKTQIVAKSLRSLASPGPSQRGFLGYAFNNIKRDDVPCEVKGYTHKRHLRGGNDRNAFAFGRADEHLVAESSEPVKWASKRVADVLRDGGDECGSKIRGAWRR